MYTDWMVQYDMKFSKKSKNYSACLWNVNITALCTKITNILILSEIIFTYFLWSGVDSIRIMHIVKILQSSTFRLAKLTEIDIKWNTTVIFYGLLIFILIRFLYIVWIIFFLLTGINNFPTTFQIYELLLKLIVKINIKNTCYHKAPTYIQKI